MEFIAEFPYAGEVLSLGSAIVWAFAVILFRISGKKVHPLGLNLYKSILAVLLLLFTLWLAGEPLFLQVSSKTYFLMLLSGIIGIGVSDTLFFSALNRLGAGHTAIVNCSYSPAVILLAALFLNERMSFLQMIGVLLILVSVYLIANKSPINSIPRKQLLAGVFMGIAAMFCMAVSIILMKPFLMSISLVWATLFRTLGGVLFIVAVLPVLSQRREILQSILSKNTWKSMLPGSFLGGYLALVFWMGGMKLTQVSTASALNQMNSVFIFVLGIILLKEHYTTSKILSLLLAVTGVLLVTLMQ